MAGHTGGKTSWQSIDRYKSKSYDRIVLTAPKGIKADVQRAAADAGLSPNRLICNLIQDYLHLMTSSAWQARSIDTDR